MSEEHNNWCEWQITGYSYKKTEDHIFAPHFRGGKRIGDMTHDELIHVIAMGYSEREAFAKALWHLASSNCKSTLDISADVRHAKIFVKMIYSTSRSVTK